MRKLLGLIGLMGLMGLFPIEPILPIIPIHAQTSDHFFDSIDKEIQAELSKEIWLSAEGNIFFIDNEYFGDRVSGYTLPGFVLKPKIAWQLHHDVTLKGGLHWLHYWGAHEYPSVTSYGAYPLYDSVSRPMHILPWLQVKMKLSNRWELTLGSLDASGHGLPRPLYNEEIALVGDPEAGFELKYKGPTGIPFIWTNLDLWTDWREYIWDRSPVPERFTAGLSGYLQHYYEDWIFSIPLHFIVQHEGGQNMSVSHNINNNFNAATGLSVSMPWRENFFDLSCRVMWYHQHGNAAIPFSKGWGIYPALSVTNGLNYKLSVSYWHGKDFVPLLGSWHFSNLSANTAGLTFDRTRVVTLQASWMKSFPTWPSKCHLVIYGTLYHYLPSTGTYADGSTHEYGHRNQFSVGASLSFYPTIKLH